MQPGAIVHPLSQPETSLRNSPARGWLIAQTVRPKLYVRALLRQSAKHFRPHFSGLRAGRRPNVVDHENRFRQPEPAPGTDFRDANFGASAHPEDEQFTVGAPRYENPIPST
jgi:hypothetical protein